MKQKDIYFRTVYPEAFKDLDPEGVEYPSLYTYNMCLSFLSTSRLPQNLNLELPELSIELGPKRSLDLHWENEKVELLINIAPGKISFYGDKQHDRNESIKGTLKDFQDNSWIFYWLYNSAR